MFGKSLRLMSFCAVVSMGASFAGCSLLDDPANLLTVNVPVSVTVPGQLPIIYPSNDTIAGLPVQSNGERVFQVPAIYVPGPDIAAQIPALSGDNVIRSVRVRRVFVTVTDNTMPVPIEPIEIRIGTLQNDFDQAYPMAFTAEVAPGQNGEVDGEIIADNVDPIGQILRTASFGLGMTTQLIIPEGTPPSGGRANAQFSFELEVTVGP